VIAGDASDPSSLASAFKGAHTVFINTTTGLKAKEVAMGKAFTDAAIAGGAQYIIFSTSPNAKKIAGSPVDIFDAKFEIEEYIRSKSVKCAFIAPGLFMKNFCENAVPRPTPEPGVYAISNVPAGTTRIPLLDTADDTGKFVAPILSEPEKYNGKILYAATKLYSYDEIAAEVSKATGKTVKYKQLPDEVWKSFLPPHVADGMLAMMAFIRDQGYFGPQTEDHVNWTLQQVKMKLTTFDEFLKVNKVPIQ